MRHLYTALVFASLGAPLSCGSSASEAGVGVGVDQLCMLAIGRSTIDDVVRLLGPPGEQFLSTTRSKFVYESHVSPRAACQDVELVFDQHNVLAMVVVWVSQDCESGTTSVPDCLRADGAQP